MKYCAKCGMLLEDTHETCIRCGSDVTQKGSYSLLPPNLEKSMENERETAKKRTLIIILISLVALALIGLLCFLIVSFKKGTFSVPAPGKNDVGVESVETGAEGPQNDGGKVAFKTEDKESEGSVAKADETKTDEPTIVHDDPENAIEEAADSGAGDNTEDDAAVISIEKPQKEEVKQEVKEEYRANGSYYRYEAFRDSGENIVISCVYPETFTGATMLVDNGMVSDVYPQQITLKCGNSDGSVNYIYMSPTQYWDKQSETKAKESRNNERDTSFFMTYLSYNEAPGYIQYILDQTYPDAQRIALIDTQPGKESVTNALKSASAQRTSALGNINWDYAHIGDDTNYAAMESTYSYQVYKYEITTRKGNKMLCKFIVPIMANNVAYANKYFDEKGTITEWYVLGLYALEAGDEELYKANEKDFDIFVANCIPKRVFFHTNEAYGKEIDKAMKEGDYLDELTAEKLKIYGGSYNANSPLSSLNEAVCKILKSYSDKSFTADGIQINAMSDAKVGFFSKTSGKVFLSSDETADPGMGYSKLK